ncbi:DUF2075 domain-containing protein [Acinetobacter indicus]|uniref:DUF2075 domain-containing protein n=1 Tax=Acinetobacter indicus TaxID=756892 RepID=UPI00398A323C
MLKSYYQNEFKKFVATTEEAILGHLAHHHQFALDELQKNAWLKQIQLLKQQLLQFEAGQIFFEFSIPRMGKRVDNILIIHDLIFVVEFKVGERQFTPQAKTQVIDYGLDLLNFHAGSHHQSIVPVLVATHAQAVEQNWSAIRELNDVLCCNAENLAEVLGQAVENFSETTDFDLETWINSSYKPTPTIIEAAQALYQGHRVEDISRSDAGAMNLEITSRRIKYIIEQSKNNKKKAICFLTGVPGAGKTLAGLNIANQRLKADESEHSVFLSGNGPLVEVLQEALIRDMVQSSKQNHQTIIRTDAARRAKTFIQNIHHFRDHYLRSTEVPVEKVVIFDEAQRAWQKEQVSNFMKQKKGIENFAMSEPEFLIDVMDRHQDWCVIVCLIGGGQEINTGEAGVSEWVAALQHSFQDWTVYYSDQILQQHVYLESNEQIAWLKAHGQHEPNLHLATSVRSFRSERVSHLVHAVLANQPALAKQIYQQIQQNYPIVLCRDLKQAKQWLKEKAKGSERYGIVASSGGRRLKAEGLDVKNKINPSDWFLNTAQDVRSAYYLEDVATEFDIQGLEIDYSCVAWDINFYFDQQWCYQSFRGSRWQRIRHEANKKYLLNAYRVLLTRARQGMVLYIPRVDGQDWTRPVKDYDATYEFLLSCGFEELTAIE